MCSSDLDSSSQVWLCVVVFLLAAELSWWEAEAVTAKVPRSFFNKARFLVFCCESSICLPPSARGRSMEFDGGPVIQLRWRKAGSLILHLEEATAISSAHYGSAERKDVAGCDVDIRLPWSRDTASWCTISAAFCSRPTLEAIWWLSSPEFFGICSTSLWRPFVELAAAFDVSSVSSGLVPDAEDGGHGLSSLFLVVGRGPNCFSNFLCRVFYVKVRGLVVIPVFLLVPTVKCTCRQK